MHDYFVRARAALDGFDAAAGALASAAGTGNTPPIVQKSRQTALILLEATAALRFSLSLPNDTAVDVADLQARLVPPPIPWLRRYGIWRNTPSAWPRRSFQAPSTASARSTRRCGRSG